MKRLIKWLLGEKCDLCRGGLRRNGASYYGVVEVNDTIGGGIKTQYQLCNLCYSLCKK